MSVSAGQVHTITTRDSVEMRRGKLECRDRAPATDTAQRRDGCLDFVCRGDAFRSSSQGAAIACLLTELTSVGNEENLR